jgi:hypothetical protein
VIARAERQHGNGCDCDSDPHGISPPGVLLI